MAIHLVGSLGYLYMALLGLGLLVQSIRKPKRRPLEMVAFLVMALGGGLFVGKGWWSAWRGVPVGHSDWNALWQSLSLVVLYAVWLCFWAFKRRHGHVRQPGHKAGKGAV